MFKRIKSKNDSYDVDGGLINKFGLWLIVRTALNDTRCINNRLLHSLQIVELRFRNILMCNFRTFD